MLPKFGTISGICAPGVAGGEGATISPACTSDSRSRTGPTNSPQSADTAATTSTVSPTCPGKRRANASPMLMASAPEDMSESPTSPPALRADLDPALITQPVNSFAKRRAAMAAVATSAR